MKLLVGQQLYYVEFGIPDITSNYSASYNKIPSVFCLANDYNDAANKGLEFAENKRIEIEMQEGKSILDDDGSIKKEFLERKILTVKSVKLVTEHLIM